MAELGRDPALAARLSELETLWRGLEPPAAEPEPMGEGARLARATLERARRRRAGPLGGLPGWLSGDGLVPAPAWGRPLVAAALAVGLALGLWLGQPAARDAGTVTEVARRVPEARPEARPVTPFEAPARSSAESAAEPATAETHASRGRQASTAPIRATAEERTAAAQEPPEDRLPARPGAAPDAPPDLEDDALASVEPAFAGEPTLAEAYLQAMEAGDDYDWEGSGP